MLSDFRQEQYGEYNGEVMGQILAGKMTKNQDAYNECVMVSGR